MKHGVLLGLLLGLAPTLALPCACCFDPGERRDVVSAVDPFVLEDLDRLRPGSFATLYVTACDIDCVEGVVDPQYDYTLEVSIDGTRWVLELLSDYANGGSIRLELAQEVHLFSTDFNPVSGGPGPKLYKEWRFRAAATGSGDFAALTPAAETELVLFGFGNRCDQVDDFAHWRLQAMGEDVDFALFGPMSAPE